jgi:hypothetical protein
MVAEYHALLVRILGLAAVGGGRSSSIDLGRKAEAVHRKHARVHSVPELGNGTQPSAHVVEDECLGINKPNAYPGVGYPYHTVGTPLTEYAHVPIEKGGNERTKSQRLNEGGTHFPSILQDTPVTRQWPPLVQFL